MPRLVNLGVPYGTVAWPDEASDEQIAADYDKLEEDRQRAIRRSKLENVRLADIVEREKPSWEKTLAATGMNIREGAIGATQQAVGNVARSLADIFAPQRPTAQWDPQTGQMVAGVEEAAPESAGGLLREAGRSIEESGSDVLRRAREETEQLGGGLPVKIGSALGSTAGASAPALLAAPLGIGAAALASGAQSFGSNLSQFRDRLMELDPKLTEEEAFQKAKAPAAFTGIATAVLTRTFGGVERLVEKIATEGLKKAGVESLLRQGFKAASMEFPEESTDQLASGLIEKAYIDPNKDVGEILNDAALAGLSGFALGGLTAGAVAAPVKTAEAVAGAVETGRLRRQSRKESQERIKRIISDREAKDAAQAAVQEGQVIDMANVQQADAAERDRLRAQGINVLEPGQEGVTNAKEDGGVPPTPSQQAPGLVQGTQGPVRVRGPEENRVEAQAGAPVAPAEEVLLSRADQEIGTQFRREDGVTATVAKSSSGQGYVLLVMDADRRPLNVIPLTGNEDIIDALPGGAQQWQIRRAEKTDLLSPAQQRIPVQIQRADGSVVEGEFNGYYDLRAMGRGAVPSVGLKLPNGQMSHTLLGEGEKIIGTVPTFEQWEAAQQVEDWARQTTAPGLQRARREEATQLVPRTETGAPAVATAPITPEFRPVDWQAFVTPTLQGNTVDWALLRAQAESGNLNGGEAANALLIHLLKRSDLHPVEISVLDITPDETQSLTEEGTRFHGRLRLRRGGGPSLIEILTKGFDGKTITQAEFVKTLNHELTHNNITTKHKYASALVQQDIRELFDFIVEKAKGTEFETHNAVTNIDEFFAEAFSSPKIQRWMSSLDYSQKIRRVGGRPAIIASPVRNSAFGRFLDIVKRILKLPDFITDAFGRKVDTITALDQAISIGIGLERTARVTAETPLVSYSPADKVIAGRSPQVQRAIGEVMAGRMSREEYNAILQQYRPVAPLTAVPTPASYAEMTDAVNGVKSISRPLVGNGVNIPPGTPVGIRADLPWKVKTGKTAVVVHAKDRGSQPGTVLAFEGTGRIENPQFLGSQKEAAKIGQGTGRSPFAAVFGEWSADQSIPADIMQWTQVGFDPTRHSYYYDKSNQNPVVGGDEAIQIAGTVFVKNPVYGQIEETLYSLAEGLQVTGAAAQVGRVADEIYSQRESGGQALESLEYERKQFKTARNELKRLADMATGLFIAEGISAEQIDGGYPDPSEGVSINDDGQIVVEDTFSNKLAAMEVAHDKDLVRSHQAEIYFELEANRLNNLRAKIDTLIQAVDYYRSLGVEQAEIDKVSKTIAKLEKQAGRLESAEYNDLTIGERASEIRNTKDEKPFAMAQRDALSLEPVSDFFGKQVGGYRDFMVKAQDGLALQKALLDKATDPTEVARLTQQVARWASLPQDVQQAIESKKPLSDEQRASAFAAMAEAFDDFDITRLRMIEMRDARTPVIDRELEALWKDLGKAKVDSGMAEVMISDVLAAVDGEIGGTGTLQSQAVAQELKSRLTAIIKFAKYVGLNLETNGALYEWLANPTSQGTFMIANSEAYGIDPGTLDMVMHEVKRNPAFSSAILTLVDSSNNKLANLPVVQIEQIQQLRGDDRREEAEALANQLRAQAQARASLANTQIRDALRKIQDLEIERMALDQGVKMFDELGASPEFSSIRNTVGNSPFGLTEPMVEQNNTATTFKPFGGKGIPAHEGFVMGAADNIVMKSEWFQKTAAWQKAAQEHIDAYEMAAMLHSADPVNNPSPQVLGFDLPKIRGLKDATSRFVPGSFLELSLLSEDKRWKVPWLVRKLNKWSWFRQHDFVAKMVGGATGTDLRGRLGDFVNHFRIARSVIQKYRDIPDLIHKAMKSHPEVRMNMANYRELWNEIAHWGRMFPTPVKPGFVLPKSGIIVTADDVTLLKKQRAFEDELRRKVTETTPVGGVRLRRGGRDLVRAGAYVGEEGLPRHLNRQADTFIADVLAAYGETPASFDETTDLSATSQHPVVAFWNRHGKLLAQHVLDSKRQDRSMTIGGLMQQSENATANDWMVNGTPAINSLEDLVNVLANQNHFPPAPGLNIRKHVIIELNKELRQYRDHANRIQRERTERDQARHSKVSIAFSAENEFTRPAAKLELPSTYYDYGALTPGEHLTITSRANHERVVAYATAVQRAIAELQNRVTRFQEETKGRNPADIEALEKKYFKSYGGDRFEAQDILGILRSIAEDFDRAYALGNPALTQSGWYREGFGLFTSAVLALPTVGLRNMTQGQFQVYNMSRAMGLSGHWLAMRDALLNMPRTLARMGLTVGAKAMRGSDMFATFVTGKNVKVFEKLVDEIAKLIGQPDYRAAGRRVNELGYDTRDGFLDRLRRIWQATEETIAPEDITKAQVNVFGAERKLSQLAGVPVKALRAAFDAIGVQQYDQVINGSLLTYAHWLRTRLEEVAQNYGQARENQGITEFDPLDPRMALKPDEWATFASQQANEDSLGLFRLFLEASANAEGFQLEKGLWDFYQAKKAGTNPQMFTPRQFDAVQGRLLAEFNASTPANRASAAAGNRVWQNLLTLQGYASDGTLKLLNAFGGARDRKAQAAVWAMVPILANLALVSILIGYFQASLTGEWEKRVRGRITSLPNPLDRDFWTSFNRWLDGTIRLGLAQLMYIGDMALAFRGEVQGNRGFDPVGKVFPISVAQRAYRTAIGSWNTYKGSGDFSDAMVPLADFGRSLVPYWLEAERLFGASQGATKQAERLARGEGQIQGLLPETRGFQGPLYGPTTIVRRNLGEAVSALAEAREKNDPVAAQAAISAAKLEMKKLEDYYAAKYIEKGDDELTAREKAQRDVWNDYQEINPVVAGLLGKRPTQAQFELIQSGLTGARGEVFNKGIKAWQNGAMELFGREGAVTREEVGASRAAGTRVRITPIPGMPRNTSTGIRNPSRSRLTPIRSVGLLRPARRTRALRAGRTRRTGLPRMRRPRVRTPAIRPMGAPVVQRPKTRLRRLSRLNKRIGRRMNRRQTYEFI